MLIIPAIDIRYGRVVRLTEGDFRLEKVYSQSPVDVARRLDSYGVELIHVVDLDGALQGKLRNLDIVKEIAKITNAKIELGGGIREIDTIELALSYGVDKIVIGTKALNEDFMKEVAKRFADRIVVAIDARHGIVRTKGWQVDTGLQAIDLAKRMETIGVKRINYTDINKDGTLEGPNLKSLKELLEWTDISVVAAGGITTIKDVKKLKKYESDGLEGVIIGKALYERTINLTEAVEAAR